MTEAQEQIKKLHRKIFVFDTSDADEKAFRICIQNWLMHESNQEFEQMLREIIWLRNDKGKTIKYMYFNERHQKIHMDRYFMEWAKLTLNEMELALGKKISTPA